MQNNNENLNGVNYCPKCGKQIEPGCNKCSYCDYEFSPKKNNNVWIVVIIICIVLLILLFIQLLKIAVIYSAMTVPTLPNNTNYQETRSALKKANASLKQALTLDYALTGNAPRNVEDLNNVFKNRISITSDSHDYVFYTFDGMRYELIPLVGQCGNYGKSEPCAKVIVDVNGDRLPNEFSENDTDIKDRFVLYAYSDGVYPEEGSLEYSLISGIK